jgi:putative phosphoribosyl transferase
MQNANEVHIPVGEFRLAACLNIPRRARGMVVLVHGGGVTRHDARHARVARALSEAGFATLLVDLLDEREARDRHNVLDVELQAERLASVTRWAREQPRLRGLRAGYFGSDIGSGVVLIAAAHAADHVHGVVCRAGRPDTALGWLHRVQAPTLFIAEAANDDPDWVRLACRRCAAVKELIVAPSASAVLSETIAWFERYVASAATASAATG